ncbi:MAG: squalene synthase HpnC [Planctomycetes bacterium]|nr:squalene synthase HpnC [Planctomycetota bacterium]
MTVQTVQQLDVYGPEACAALPLDEARRFCRRLATRRAENFSVLSAVVPRDCRDDFAAVYAFCRWADDLGDEVGDRDRARELLAWWRDELRGCFAGEPRHPVFVALEPVIRAHDLPIEPFDDLIRAFEQDQQVTRYETWDDVLGYCRLSADPVGRLVLMILGEPREERLFELSDAICTALQLTNHWQDIRRDVLERDRIYVPRELVKIERFEERLRDSARQGWAVDRTFLPESRALVRVLVDRTWPFYERGTRLLETLGPRARPLVWLLSAGGVRVLRLIEHWNYETVLHRPAPGRATKLALIARAWWAARRAGTGAGTGDARSDA